jgi:hypothetical protein
LVPKFPHSPFPLYTIVTKSLIDGVPDVLELLYIRKDRLSNLEKRKNSFPIEGLDFPNNPAQPDIKLDWWLK